ncbi:MAG TPA: DUF1156 domain-containing protein [Candidatus Ozemobacteraceae bacterium]
MAQIKTPRKLIEVALPLDDINVAAAREKSIRHGHPSTLHLWWARRPLAAARAVIFAQMVNDPGFERHLQRGMNKEKAAAERERLFRIIRDLVQWENTTNERVLEEAREEIRKSWRETCELNKDHPQAAELFNPEKLPAFHDPFAGGGALPLEAQRLGLEAWASDLNPVAVLINKAMIEIPPKFASRAPVGPIPEGENQPRMEQVWPGATGLAEDVRRYGAWMRQEAEKRIGHLYPKVKVTPEMAKDRPDLAPYVGEKLTVIAWLWARTVRSPNPAFSDVHVPLVSSFWLSTKKGKEAWIEPVIEGKNYRFVVRMGGTPQIEELVNRKGGTCLLSGSPMPFTHIRAEGQAGRMGVRLFAVVAEGTRGRVYLSPSEDHAKKAAEAQPAWRPEALLPDNPRDFKTPNYGMKKIGDLFTDRQLVALNTFSDLIQEARAKVIEDARATGWTDDGLPLDQGGTGPTAYGDALAMYLTCGVDRLADRSSTICGWDTGYTKIRNTFGRQALPMTWDFAEGNPFSDSTGNFSAMLEWVEKFLISVPARSSSQAVQQNAQTQIISRAKLISTDPPYYDNIGYADLSDFFYVWMRRALKDIYPKIFTTMAVPKAEELVATPYRHGSREKAEAFFLNGMTKAVRNLAELAHPAFPTTIYYAFKQSETTDSKGTSSTGWETFLDAVLKAGFSLTGTWPMRTELGNRMIASDTNALASSIVLVCRKRPDDAASISRREFIRELDAVLPEALDEMTRGAKGVSPVAPVDLSQAIIGPGMAIFSKYKAVLEADGSPMTVKTALTLINRFLAEDDFDHDTQFCLHWFETHGWNAGPFGDADVLARAKGTSVDGLKDAGVVDAGRGNVRLFKWAEYPADWNPVTDNRTPVWEAMHQMIRAHQQAGEEAAGRLLAAMPSREEAIRQLAYRLYTLCERSGRAEDARFYNELIIAWPGIESASSAVGRTGTQQKLDL